MGLSGSGAIMQGMVLSAVNGVGLSLVIPNAQSITADYYDELDRGKAFGALYMTSALGGAFGSLYATNQGQHLCCLPVNKGIAEQATSRGRKC